jgi:hypothetical protein
MNAPCSDVHAAFPNVVFVSAGLKGVDNIVAFTLARCSRRRKDSQIFLYLDFFEIYSCSLMLLAAY